MSTESILSINANEKQDERQITTFIEYYGHTEKNIRDLEN